MTDIYSFFMLIERGGSFSIYEGKAFFEQINSLNITIRQGFRTEIFIGQLNTNFLDLSCLSNFTV
jgi:hypothetical protein